MSYGGQDGPQGLEAHGDVEQVGSEEEVVVVAQDGHGGVPDQIQEGLEKEEPCMRSTARKTFGGFS